MLSTIVLTRNEEKNIKACLESVKFCDEVIVIDDYSDDSTMKLAKKLGAKVFKRKLNGDFAAQRNYGLDKAKGEWVLFIDADERVPLILKDEILTEVQIQKHIGSESVPAHQGFYLKREDILWEKKLRHGESGQTKLLRLARKGSGKWARKVHETWNVAGEVKTLKNFLLHYPHQTISEFLVDVNKYSTVHAQENYHKGKQSNVLKILLWPKLKFSQNYVFKGGLLDGDPGFVAAMMMSFHSFLAWSKLYLVQRRKT